MTFTLYGDTWDSIQSLDGTWDSLQVYDPTEDCCCGDPPVGECDCDDMCESPSWRITFSGLLCPPSNDPATCEIVSTYTGTFTEGDVGDITGDLPCDVSNLNRYWTSETDMDCADPTDPLLELACCNIGGSQNVYIRINSQSWCLANGVDDCLDYWNQTGISSAEFDLSSDPSCCGSAALEITCGTMPDQVCGGPNPTSTGPGTCN